MFADIRNSNWIFYFFGRFSRLWKWKPRQYCQPEISDALRMLLQFRDGGKCQLCGKPGTIPDHIKPLALGGKTVLSNLRTLCAPCNLKERNRLVYGKD